MKETIEKQRDFFASGKTLDLKFRLEQLEALRRGIQKCEGEILHALESDLGKSAFEGYETEVGLVLEEISFAKKHLREWARSKRVRTPFLHFPSKSKIVKEPLGVVLIMSPWNYPFQLTMAPLAAALAAGNCAVLKPSRYAAATAEVMGKLVRDCFSPEYVCLFQGGRDVNAALLRERFDHIFFTGSVDVGKSVMRAAAEHLTPVTLELGGKSPVLVDQTADIDLAARRIVWGKCLNAGQTCVAPDYVLVQEEAREELLRAMEKYIRVFYGAEPLKNPEYPKIINTKHFARLSSLLPEGKIRCGGRTDPENRKIEPTLLEDVSAEDPVMQEEIFGPILPVLSFREWDEALTFVKSREKPLALYLFTTDRAAKRRVLGEVSFGGGCINDTVVHLTNPHMHFGGVGQSGMGAYHGKKGFYTFSHEKCILEKSNALDIRFRYPPYGGRLSLLKKLMK